MSELINITDLHKFYSSGDNQQSVLNGINLKINKAEQVSIMGQSGSGKSTLLNILGLLDNTYQSGQYHFLENNVATLDADQRADIRNLKIGFVFQSYMLISTLCAWENVALPLRYRGMADDEAKERACALLTQVGLSDKVNRLPSTLSGGQQQRVAIARALVGQPDLVLADEPTGALDPSISQQTLDLFLEMNQTYQTALIVITHDAQVAKQCQRQLELIDGRLR